MNNIIIHHGINLQCFPLCFNSSLTDDDLNQRECGDGIYVSADRFRYFNNTDSEELVIIKITNGEFTTYAQIIGVHSDRRNKVFMPAWMFEYLNVECTYQVLLERCTDISIGLHIRIRPHSSKYASLDDPVSALRNGFENYIVLKGNTDIPLLVDGERLIVSIIDTFSNEPICIRGVELEVEIEQPMDYKKPTEKPFDFSNMLPIPTKEPFDFSNMLPLPTIKDKHFSGKGYVLGSKMNK